MNTHCNARTERDYYYVGPEEGGDQEKKKYVGARCKMWQEKQVILEYFRSDDR